MTGVVALGARFDERRNTSAVRAIPYEVVSALKRNREKYQRERPDWYVWIEARQQQRHEHHLLRQDGGPAACPVYGCTAVT